MRAFPPLHPVIWGLLRVARGWTPSKPQATQARGLLRVCSGLLGVCLGLLGVALLETMTTLWQTITSTSSNPEQLWATLSNLEQNPSDSKQPRGLISLFNVTDYLLHVFIFYDASFQENSHLTLIAHGLRWTSSQRGKKNLVYMLR